MDSLEFEPCAIRLAEIRHFDRAIGLADKIREGDTKARTLYRIAQALIQAGKIDKAIKIVPMIPSGQDHKEILTYDIAKILTRSNELRQAMDIIQEMLPIKKHESAFIEITEFLVKADNIDGAIEWASMLSDLETRPYAFLHIFETLKQAKKIIQNIDRSLELATLVPERYRDDCHAVILAALVEATNFDKAIELLSRIHGEDKISLIAAIIVDLTKAKLFDKAIEVAELLPDAETKAEILQELVEASKAAVADPST